LAADEFVEEDAGGDGDVEGVGAAGHGEGDGLFAQGAELWREAVAFFAKGDGEGTGGKVGPGLLGFGGEGDEGDFIDVGPVGELGVGEAGEGEVEDAAHAGADDGGVEGVYEG